MEWEKQLNERQLEAVRHGEGPLLVLAGAGSGKTRVLTYRFARLVRSERIPPANILAVTFTNKAAGEMKERIAGLIGPLPHRLWAGTFHSVGVRILRESAPLLGGRSDFTIFDQDDQRKVLKSICRERGLEPNGERIDGLVAAIRRHKMEGKEERAARREWPPAAAEGEALFPHYEAALRRMNALDFDDLLALSLRLLRERPDVLASYARRFEHVLVDEFQDTNRVQNELLRLFSSSHRNVCAVGDDDQSIYGWRGADVGNILRFEKSFPGARVIRLERNYRSSAPILAAAHAVIRNNVGRRGKKLWTDRKEGEPVSLYRFRSEREEGLFLAAEIAQRIATGRGRPGEASIFYRTNAQSRSLEEGLRVHAIPYSLVGGTRFYERREVKDVLAYLRLFWNGKDDVSCERILNVPARGIGDRTRERLKRFAAREGLSLLEASGRANEIAEVKKGARERLLRFHRFAAAYTARARRESPHRLTRDLVAELHFVAYLEEREGEKGTLRGENVKEFVSATAEFETRNGEAGLADFLAEVSLLTDLDDWEEEPDRVTLMTLHSSKGLEFDRVYIAGVEEGLLPHLLSTDREEAIEEERRLFYVGLTRARQKVTLSYATSRFRFGDFAVATPSRFLEEIPERLLAREPGAAGRPRGAPARRSDLLPDHETGSREVVLYRAGDRIRHGTWGEGRVVAVEGEGTKTKLTVAFARGCTKKIVARFASIERIGPGRSVGRKNG